MFRLNLFEYTLILFLGIIPCVINLFLIDLSEKLWHDNASSGTDTSTDTSTDTTSLKDELVYYEPLYFISFSYLIYRVSLYEFVFKRYGFWKQILGISDYCYVTLLVAYLLKDFNTERFFDYLTMKNHITIENLKIWFAEVMKNEQVQECINYLNTSLTETARGIKEMTNAVS